MCCLRTMRTERIKFKLNKIEAFEMKKNEDCKAKKMRITRERDTESYAGNVEYQKTHINENDQ